MSEIPATSEPLEPTLTGAGDRLRLNHWMPSQPGIVPRICIGERWVSPLWGLPIGDTALIVSIAIAQRLRELSSGTEEWHKVDAESFRSAEHLRYIQPDAESIVEVPSSEWQLGP